MPLGRESDATPENESQTTQEADQHSPLLSPPHPALPSLANQRHLLALSISAESEWKRKHSQWATIEMQSQLQLQWAIDNEQ